MNISLKIDHAPCTSDRLPEAKRSCSIILRVNYQSTRETARPRTRHGYLSPEFRKAGRGLGHRTGRLRTCGTSHDKVLVADVRTVGTTHHRTGRLSTLRERSLDSCHHFKVTYSRGVKLETVASAHRTGMDIARTANDFPYG